MTENPYDAPTAITAADADPYVTSMARPVSIAILAGLLWASGIIQVCSRLLTYLQLTTSKEILRFFGIPPEWLMAAMLFLPILMIVAGIGVWNGAKWGWWFAYIYCIFGVMLNGLAVFGIVGHFQSAHRELAAELIAYGGRLFVYVLLLLFLFKRDLRKYFGLKTSEPRTNRGLLTSLRQ